MDLFAEERQREIEGMLLKSGAVATQELSLHFGVSIETVRRDLLQMEKQGRLQRVHGGAVAAGETKPYRDLKDRLNEHDGNKRALSVAAAKRVREGDILGVDAGSTALFFAEALAARFRALTVVTYSLDVFEHLNRNTSFRVFLCGGSLFRDENAFCDSFARETLSRFHVQKAFIFPYAVSIRSGICDHREEVCAMQRQMIGRADQVYVLADSSKFERTALVKTAEMDLRFTYVTDGELSQELRALYDENHYTIITGGKDER